MRYPKIYFVFFVARVLLCSVLTRGGERVDGRTPRHTPVLREGSTRLRLRVQRHARVSETRETLGASHEGGATRRRVIMGLAGLIRTAVVVGMGALWLLA